MDELREIQKIGRMAPEDSPLDLGVMRERLIDRIRRPPRRDVTASLATLVVGTVSIAAVLWGLSLGSEPNQHLRSEGRATQQTTAGQETEQPTKPLPGGATTTSVFDLTQPPLLGGHRVGLSEAQQAVTYPLYRPDGGGLRDPEVWVAEGTSESGEPLASVALRYGQELVLLYSPITSPKDPAELLSTEAADWGQGHMTTVREWPVWLVPASQDRRDGSVSLAYVAVGRLQVELLAHMPADDLLTVVRSLRI